MKKALTLSVCLLAFAQPAFAAMQVIDQTQILKTTEVIKETGKTREAAEGTLEQAKDIVKQSQKLNKALGDGAKIGVDAFGWMNSATSAANSAMQACGIDGFLPPLEGFEIPGIDLPSFDLSCITSAFKAVEEGLYTYRKFKNIDPSIKIQPGSGEYAAQLHHPSYHAIGHEAILKRQQEYRVKTIKSVQAAANRQSDMGGEVLGIENKIAALGADPRDINSLLRILISLELAQLKSANEYYASFARYIDMQAAQLMHQVPLNVVEDGAN